VIILSLAFFGDEESIEVTITVMHTVLSRLYILHVPYCFTVQCAASHQRGSS